MIKFEDDCRDCDSPAYPCLGKSCPLRHAKHYYCDECGSEEDLYYLDNDELCRDCVISRLEEVI